MTTTQPAPVHPVLPAAAESTPESTLLSATEATPEVTSDRRTQVLAALAATTTIVLWASAFVVIRASGTELSPGPMALARVGVAAAVLTPFVLRGRKAHTGRSLLPRGRALVPVIAYGALWFAGYNVALNAAERHVDAGTAALLVNVAPVLIAVGGVVVLREPRSRALLFGCLIAFGGVAVMAAGPGGQRDAWGIGLGLAAAVLYAVSVLFQKVTLRDLDALQATWLGTVVGTVVLLPFAGELWAQARTVPASALWGAVYLGVFPTAIAFTAWAYALRRMPAGRLGPLGYLVTVLSVLLSWAFLDEVPTTAALVGGAICLVGVAVSRVRPRSGHQR